MTSSRSLGRYLNRNDNEEFLKRFRAKTVAVVALQEKTVLVQV